MLHASRAHLLVPALALAALGGGQVTTAHAARAPYTVTGCAADASTPAPKIEVHPDWFAGGKLVALMDNTGAVNPNLGSAPPGAIGFHATPLCVTRLDKSGKPRKPAWLFCLNRPLDACGNNPYKRSGIQGGREELSLRDRTRLAYVLNQLADYSTAQTRGVTAQYIWCVTEKLPDGALVVDNKLYGNLKCPDWSKVGKELPPEKPYLKVSADKKWQPAGATASFTLKTNIRKLTIRWSGMTLKSCTKHVKIKGNKIVLTEGVTKARLCGRRTKAGRGTLAVSQHAVIVPGLSFWVTAGPRTDCQGMVESAPRRKVRAGRAATNWAPTPLKDR